MVHSVKHFVPVSRIAAFFALAAVSFYFHAERRTGGPREEEGSFMGREDDPDAKVRYEWMRLHDPVTGEIPKGIRQRELAFASTLPSAEKPDLAKLPNGRAPGSVQSITWSGRGPANIGGRTRALAVDATNSSTILAGGVSGGMWRSLDGGASWTRTTGTSQIPSSTCIAQDTRSGHTSTWYYGTGEYIGNSANGGGQAYFNGNGIFKSTDNGASWATLPSTTNTTPQLFASPFDYVWNVVTDPSTPGADIVYAACYSVIERSTNGGSTWTQVLGAFPGSGYSDRTDIQITSTGVLYATGSSAIGSTISGIWRSTNGTTWTNITPSSFPSLYSRIVIGIAPSNESIVYFLAQGTGGTNGTDQINGHQFWQYTYISGDGSGSGGSWVNRGMNLPNESGLTGNAIFDTQRGYDMLVRVKPDDPNFVIVGSTNLYRSTDAFATKTHWQRIGGYASANTYAWYTNQHPDQHGGAFLPGSTTTFLASHDEGISETSDITASTVTWSSLNNSYLTTQYYTIALDHATSGNNVLVGGMQDNGTWFTGSASASAGWIQLYSGDGAACAIADGRTSYYVSAQNGIAYRFLVNGSGSVTDYARIDPTGGSGYLFVNPFVLDPSDTKVMYLAGGSSLWRNSDLTGVPLASVSPGTATSTTTVNWTNLTGAAVSGTSITALGVSRNTPSNRLYYGTSNAKIYRLDNASTATTSSTPTDVWTGQGFPAGGYVSCIAVDPSNGDNAMAVFSNYNAISLFYTSNAGTNWTAVAGNLEQNANGSGNGPSVRWAAILPYGGSTYYYAGTSIGLYSTQTLNGTSTVWAQEGSSTIGNIVVDMIDTRLADGLVVVGTHGGGVYSGTVAPASVDEKTYPLSTALLQNYPNPFNPSTEISYQLSAVSSARLAVFDVTGREVSVLVNEVKQPGTYTVRFDGSKLASGVYLARLTAGSFADVRKMMLVK